MTRNRLIASVALASLLYLGCMVVALAQPTFTVTLSWTAPITNEDGSTLTNLAGYRVYYGRSAEEVVIGPNVIEVGDPGAVQHVLTQNVLQPNTLYFFAVTAVNTNGVESALSNIAQHTTPDTSVPGAPTNVSVEIVFNAG